MPNTNQNRGSSSGRGGRKDDNRNKGGQASRGGRSGGQKQSGRSR
jgi:hypothetical protein